jgi:hypothetical protein
MQCCGWQSKVGYFSKRKNNSKPAITYNGYEVAGYASNFVSSNDLFAPPAAAWTNRESTAQLGIRPAAGGANKLNVKK